MENVIGIVAEYNPFHNGHKTQIEYAKKVLNADYIVVALSSDFTQRGDISFLSKYERAKAALMNEVDLVIEIPVIYSCASAEYYATAGVNLLYATGIVDTVLFSGESDDMEMYEKISNIIVKNSRKYNYIIRKNIEEGYSYPVARNKAITRILEKADGFLHDDIKEFLSQPNNILGIEYIKAIKLNAPELNYYCMKRTGDPYHSSEIESEYPSASAIRLSIFDDSINECFDVIPPNLIDKYGELVEKQKYMHPNDISLLLHNRLMDLYVSSNYDKEVFSVFLDCSKDLSCRIANNLNEFMDFLSFVELLKTKNYTFTRISRVLCHILLDIKEESFDKKCSPTFIYVLGVREDSIEILKEMNRNSTVPVFTNRKELEEQVRVNVNVINDRAYYIFHTLLTNRRKKKFVNEIERRFLKV